MATFITAQSVGLGIGITIQTSTGYWKYNHDGSDSSVFSNGYQPIIVQNANGEFTIIPCLSDGTVSGNITNLDLQNNQLTSFDGTGLTSLIELGLGGNQLTLFDGTDLSSLTSLGLSDNQLTSFDGTGLSSLNWLNLENNQLTSFDGTDLTSLNDLNLNGNQLTSFDPTGLTSLERLFLVNNQLTSFDGTGLSSLERLFLNNNLLTSFDGTDLSSINVLNLYGNPLTSFNGGDMNLLQDLNFSQWDITTLESFDGGNMTGLTGLYLNGNQLTSFDGTDLTSLTNLELNDNQLTSLSGFTFPSSLTYLALINNQLTSLDGTDLTSLTYLALINNQLTSFDGTGLSSLIELHLQGNQLTSFDGTGLTGLQYLNLNGNNLTSLSGFTFPTSLTNLTLESNQLTSFGSSGLTSLTYLGLYKNFLTSFDGTGLTSLTTLNLIDNQLTSLDVSPMVSLQTLYLVNSYGIGGNPMTAVSNNSILDQLNANGVENGNFFTSNGRTSDGTADYDSLVGKGWNLIGLDLPTPPPSGNGKLRIKGVNSGGGTTTTTTTEAPSYTIKTINPVGESFGIQNIVTSTGYWLYSHDGTNSAPYEGNATSITVTNANGEFTFISCLSDGTPSGNIIELGFANGSLITDFNGLGLSDLTYLNLQANQLTSFDGVGLTSLTTLGLNSNEELTSITNLPLTLVSLSLVGSPITSIDISGMNSLTSLYLADAYGTNALVTSTNNSSILAQLDSSNISDGTFITSNGRTSAGNTSYDNLINKGWNIMGAEEEISLLFDLTVDNGIPNQLVVLITASSGGPAKGPGGPGAKGPGGPGGGITEYASIVTDENGIAVFSGITGSTTMWAVQVYNTPVKEGMVVWMSEFEANNSTTSVTQTRTFYDVNFLNQDDNGVISNSSVDIYLVDGGKQANSDGDNIYPIFMFSGTTDVNGNITTNLSSGSYIIRTFDENGDLTWGQYFDVFDDVVSISRPLSEDVEINISGLITTTYTNMWTVNNNAPVEGMDVYYYDGSKQVYSFDPLSPIGQSTIVNPTLTLLGQTDPTGGFTTNGTPVSISSGVIGVTFGNTDNEGKLYDVVSNEYNTIELGTNINGTKVVEWTDQNLSIQYSEWHPQAPTGKHIRISVVQNANWVAIDSFNSVEGVNTYFSRLAGGTEYKLDMYNDLTVIADGSNIGYTEYWTPNWNDSKTTIWDGVPN